MKKYLFFLSMIALATIARAQNDQETPFLTKSFANQAISSVESSTSGGSISVTGSHSADARVEMYVHPNNDRKEPSKDEIQKWLNEEFEVTIAMEGNKLKAIAKAKNPTINWHRNLSIGFKIFVPQKVSTNLTTSGGSIHLTDLAGNQDFSTSGGSLHVTQVVGKMKGSTSGGSIHVSDSKDDIDLSTSGGSIEANNCTGNIRLSTSGGSLKLAGLNGTVRATTSGGSVKGSNISGELNAHTSGGNVTLTDLSCSVETSTSGGNIDVEIKELGKYVKIRNSGGHVDLQVPAGKGLDLKLYGGKIHTEALKNFTGSASDSELNGSVNGGGIPVNVDAGGGRISLSFR